MSALVRDPLLRQTLQEEGGFLRRMPDLERLSLKLRGGRATLRDLLDVYRGVQRLPAVANAIEAAEEGEEKATAEQAPLVTRFAAPPWPAPPRRRSAPPAPAAA